VRGANDKGSLLLQAFPVAILWITRSPQPERAKSVRGTSAQKYAIAAKKRTLAMKEGWTYLRYLYVPELMKVATLPLAS
jgi:hypothetical protein